MLYHCKMLHPSQPPRYMTLRHLMSGALLAGCFLVRDAHAQSVSSGESTPMGAADSCAPFRMGMAVAPLTLLTYGAAKPMVSGIGRIDRDLRTRISDQHPAFRSRADDWLQWAPSATVYVLDGAGVKLKHRFRDHLLLDAGSILVTGGAGFVMRKLSERIEGFGIVDTQFPSGHTANAFRGAELLRQELAGRHPALRWSGYLVAGAVAASRLLQGEHHLSEVVAGAGLGMLSTRLTYALHHHVKRLKSGRAKR